MARYSLTYEAIALSPFGNTSNLTDSLYPFFLQGGNATMRMNISEVYSAGESGSSAVTHLKLARDSTVAATGISGNANTLIDASAIAPGTAPVFGNVATTKPQRSTSHILNISFNAFGGLVRWVARQGEEPSIVGASASLGEMSLSAFTGGSGTVSGHCIYEVA